MNNTMISIGKHITSNLSAFGLATASDLLLIENPKSTLPNGSKRLMVRTLRTLPDHTRGVPFNNLIASKQKGIRFLTLIEFNCMTRAPNPSKDFFWNTVRLFRDEVYDALAGPNHNGITIPRYDWEEPENPVVAGEIWFEVNPVRNSPMEDPVEDPNDPANKFIFLTYSAHWWKPITKPIT